MLSPARDAVFASRSGSVGQNLSLLSPNSPTSPAHRARKRRSLLPEGGRYGRCSRSAHADGRSHHKSSEPHRSGSHLRPSAEEGLMKLSRLSRRGLLRWGIVLGGGAVLPAGRRVSRADDLPSSPNTTPFVQGLPIAPIATPVTPFDTQPDPANCVNVDGSRAFHVHGPRVVPSPTPG